MERLAGVVVRTTNNTLFQKAAFNDWRDLFQVIADYKPEEKKVLVIDEFPYLVYEVQTMPFEKAVEQYAVTGGVPKYLEFFEDGRELAEQLKETVLSKNGFLYIEKRTPVTEKNPEKSRKGLYFIADNFIRFWFRYVYPYKGELDNMQIVMDEMDKDFTTGFLAFVYEDMCKNIFADLCKDGAIPFTPSRIGTYWLNDYDGDTEKCRTDSNVYSH